jgi:hypothetical protein
VFPEEMGCLLGASIPNFASSDLLSQDSAAPGLLDLQPAYFCFSRVTIPIVALKIAFPHDRSSWDRHAPDGWRRCRSAL